MAVSEPRTQTALSDQVAEEIRALLARRRISGRELARRMGKPPAWVNFRLTGHTAISFDDAQRIAETLGIPFLDLLPRHLREGARGDITPGYSRLAERWTSAARPRRGNVRPATGRSSAKTSRPPNVPEQTRRPVLLPRRIGA